jgi:hypothetical protein
MNPEGDFDAVTVGRGRSLQKVRGIWPLLLAMSSTRVRACERRREIMSCKAAVVPTVRQVRVLPPLAPIPRPMPEVGLLVTEVPRLVPPAPGPPTCT